MKNTDRLSTEFRQLDKADYENAIKLFNRLSTLDINLTDYHAQLNKLHKACIISRSNYEEIQEKLLDVCIVLEALAHSVETVKQNIIIKKDAVQNVTESRKLTI